MLSLANEGGMGKRWVVLMAEAVLAAAVLWWLPALGNAALYLAAACMALGAVAGRARVWAWPLGVALIYGACLALAFHLLSDDFHLRYVWLYSGAALPWWLKLAGLWGGDEGTVLLLAVMCATGAIRYWQRPGWTPAAPMLIAAWYTATSAWLGQFVATPAGFLATGASGGLNAHLDTVWMAIHPPLVLAAYAWVLVPSGAALAALAGDEPLYRTVALRNSRLAWLVLTAGIGFGMAWALEDFTFGSLWHWDPVQTAAFAVWALLAAVLHGAKRWRPGEILCPMLTLLAAATVCLALAVTRSTLLASSHRFVGSTSLPSHLAFGGILLVAAIGFAGVGRRTRPRLSARALDTATWTLKGAQWLFIVAAAMAVVGVAYAYVFQWLQVERDASFKPYMNFIINLSRSNLQQVQALTEVFAQWTVDGYTLGGWLLPVLAAAGLLGGFAYLRKFVGPRMSLLLSAGACVPVIYVYFAGGWITSRYRGTGILSEKVVVMLPAIDAMLVAEGFLLVACAAWCVVTVWRALRVRVLRRNGALALIHCGAVLALVGGVTSVVLNSYTPVVVPAAADLQTWQKVSPGLEVKVVPERSGVDIAGYRALAKVQVRENGKMVQGHALFEDNRKLPPGFQGAARQLCEIVDYRYGRFVSDPDNSGYMLQPFVLHRFPEQVQVWVTASPRLLGPQALDEGEILLVERRYPLVAVLWVGLLMMFAGALVLPRVPDR